VLGDGTKDGWGNLGQDAESGKKNILEGANGAFGRVRMVNAGWNKLEAVILLNEEILENGGAGVVEA
jgi:hypothetical protein